MTKNEIDAATKVVMGESNMDEPRARAFAKRVLAAAEDERVKFLEGVFGPEHVSAPTRE